MSKSKARCDGDRGEQMGSIEEADIELVAHIRPGDFAHQLKLKAFGSRKALVGCDNEGGRVAERDETDPQSSIAHLNSSAAVMTDCATSAILRFSFMAVLRSSA